MITAIRKLSKKDSARIKCSASVNKKGAMCRKQATSVEQHESSGSMFFWYFCDKHIHKS